MSRGFEGIRLRVVSGSVGWDRRLRWGMMFRKDGVRVV